MQQDKPVTIDVFFAANGRGFFPFIVLSFLQSVCLKDAGDCSENAALHTRRAEQSKF